MYDFCQILNENKHNSLSPQTRTSQKTYSVGLPGKFPAISAPAGEITAPPGEILIDGIPVEFDLNTGIPLQTSGLEVLVTTWVSFVFQDTSIEVYPLLQIALNKIREASRKLYEKIKEAGPIPDSVDHLWTTGIQKRAINDDITGSINSLHYLSGISRIAPFDKILNDMRLLLSHFEVFV